MLLIRCKAKGTFFLILLHLSTRPYPFPSRLFLYDNSFRFVARHTGAIDPFHDHPVSARTAGKLQAVGQSRRPFFCRAQAQRLPKDAFRLRFFFPVIAGSNQNGPVETEGGIGQGLPACVVKHIFHPRPTTYTSSSIFLLCPSGSRLFKKN